MKTRVCDACSSAIRRGQGTACHHEGMYSWSANVRLWHLADIDAEAEHVRSWGSKRTFLIATAGVR